MIHWRVAWMRCIPLQFRLIKGLYIYHVKYCAGSTKTYAYLRAIINMTCSITVLAQYSSEQSSLKLSRRERPLLPREVRPTVRGEERKTKQILLPSSWVTQWVSDWALGVTAPLRMAQSWHRETLKVEKRVLGLYLLCCTMFYSKLPLLLKKRKRSSQIPYHLYH